MIIQLFQTEEPEQKFTTVEELLKYVVEFKTGKWIFQRTKKYKLTSFSEEIKQAVSKNPEVLKLNFSKNLVSINAFLEKKNVYSKNINLWSFDITNEELS